MYRVQNGGGGWDLQYSTDGNSWVFIESAVDKANVWKQKLKSELVSVCTTFPTVTIGSSSGDSYVLSTKQYLYIDGVSSSVYFYGGKVYLLDGTVLGVVAGGDIALTSSGLSTLQKSKDSDLASLIDGAQIQDSKVIIAH